MDSLKVIRTGVSIDTLRNASMTVDAGGRVVTLRDTARYAYSITPTTVNYLYTGLGHMLVSDYETRSPDGYTALSAIEESFNDAMGNWVGRYNSASDVFGAPGGSSFSESNTTRLGRYESGTGRLVGDSLVGDHTDTLVYDGAGNLHATYTVNGGSPERYQDRVSYYSVDGKLVAADARSVAFGGTALQGHTAFEEYRYDALGRRIWTRARRWCDDTHGAGGGPNAVSCQVSSVRRTVWDGNQELAEIEMPATDSTSSSTIENDTLAISTSVPGTGDALYDANRLYGQVLYVNGLETDRPLAITRNHYADASSTTGSQTYAVYAPFSVIPLWNNQGRADRAVIGGTAAPGQDYLCTDSGKTRCAYVYLDQGVFPYARSGAATGSWNGTVLVDKADATGTYYRRARTYDPSSARFTQEDPIGLAGGINEYGFASGDPANYGDPFGLWCEKDGDPCPSLMDRINAGMAKAFSDLLDKTIQIAGAAANLVSPLGDMLTAAGENPAVQGKSDRAIAGAMAVLGTIGSVGAAEKAASRLSTSEAADLAGYLGFTRRVKDAPFNSHGQAVFTNGKTFITQDIDMHLGADATWKMFSRSGQRMGTFGSLLNRLGN